MTLTTTTSSTTQAGAVPGTHPVTVSPLVLADRLLGLARDADQAGLRRPAADLVKLAFAMYDEQPLLRRVTSAWNEYPSA
jgi:hypothetical protein